MKLADAEFKFNIVQTALQEEHAAEQAKAAAEIHTQIRRHEEAMAEIAKLDARNEEDKRIAEAKAQSLIIDFQAQIHALVSWVLILPFFDLIIPAIVERTNRRA